MDLVPTFQLLHVMMVINVPPIHVTQQMDAPSLQSTATMTTTVPPIPATLNLDANTPTLPVTTRTSAPSIPAMPQLVASLPPSMFHLETVASVLTVIQSRV